MKQNKLVTARFAKFVPGGQTLGELADGRKVFAWGVLPGETAEIALTKDKKSYAEGFAMRIIEPSPRREKPRDSCYLATSPWQILRWDDELRAKEDLVRESFAQEKIAIDLAPITTDDQQFGYRNKMEYSLYLMSADEARKSENADFLATFSPADLTRHYVDHGEQIIGGKIFLAFHQRSSHLKTPILHSSIERPEIFAKAQAIVDELNARGEVAWKYQSLLVRGSQNGDVSAALFENRRPHPVMKQLSDTILGHQYSYSPNGFFQINLPVYELALREIAAHVASEKVVDMYSGVGSIGLSLINPTRQITLVETDNSAFREMSENVANLPAEFRENVHAIHAKSEDALDNLSSDCDLILDPPRAGLDKQVVVKIREIRPQKVIYLSCNPTTQARDVAAIIADREYKIIFAKPFNFFPRTPHIENLVVLERA